MARIRATPEPAPPERFRSALVPLDELAATLNQWHAEGFTAWDWWHHDEESPAYGQSAGRVHLFAERPDAEDAPPPEVVLVRPRITIIRRSRRSP